MPAGREAVGLKFPCKKSQDLKALIKKILAVVIDVVNPA